MRNASHESEWRNRTNKIKEEKNTQTDCRLKNYIKNVFSSASALRSVFRILHAKRCATVDFRIPSLAATVILFLVWTWSENEIKFSAPNACQTD